MGNFYVGDPKPKEYILPDISQLLHHSKHESLFVFGTMENNRDYRLCLGVGTVMNIQKGNEMDMVTINFGRKKARKIIVKHNHARRQIYTLKLGQLAWFYGYYKCYGRRTYFFAKGLQGWYVPKILDIKNYDGKEMPELEEEKDMLNFLDKLKEKL